MTHLSAKALSATLGKFLLTSVQRNNVKISGKGSKVIMFCLTRLRDDSERDLLRSRNEAEQLSEVILHSSDAVIASNIDGMIRNWSNGAAKMFGFSSAEAVGRSFTELILSADARDFLALPIRELAHSREFNGEIVARRADGTRFDASIMLTPHWRLPEHFSRPQRSCVTFHSRSAPRGLCCRMKNWHRSQISEFHCARDQ